MLSNMACSLIDHKRINTTVAKAKALKQYVEPLITKAKNDSTHSRELYLVTFVRKKLLKNYLVQYLLKLEIRPGGYTRIIKIGNRLGDNAEMCMIELVDFNDVYTNGKDKRKLKHVDVKSQLLKLKKRLLLKMLKLLKKHPLLRKNLLLKEAPVAEANLNKVSDAEEAPASDENSKDEEEKSDDANDEDQEA
ncbi:MAG: hypothetical protein CM15mP23_13760 [Cryomorphaceae bacterium]|nr:MAG: hypothetical protein CM15mP23_13760 [Cryomorphaceae bacterium]